MKASIERLKTSYAQALHEYLDKKNESALQRAYEVGREAILVDSSLLHVVTVHHDVLSTLMKNTGESPTTVRKVELAGDFLRETLASFEMIQRGYADTVSSLRQRTDELDESNQNLLKLNETLESRVAEKTATVAEKNKALARVNSEMEQFVHAAAHDLKEPLRTITSYVQLLQRVYQDQLQGDANLYIQYVVEGTHRLQELIDDLLSYTRLSAEPVPPQPVDLSKLLQGTLAGLETVIKEKTAQVTFTPLPVIRSNQAHMTLLFQNLISNGLKFHGKDSPRIHVAAQREGENWLFSVTDNGIGIDEKYFGKLFIVFQRLNTREEYPGTGIGLALCRKIVEQQNGKIWVKSKVGQGTTFYFTLPAEGEKR